MKGTTSLILGALLVAGLSLALACCGTLKPQIEAGPAATTTLLDVDGDAHRDAHRSAWLVTQPLVAVQQDVHALLLDTFRLE